MEALKNSMNTLSQASRLCGSYSNLIPSEYEAGASNLSVAWSTVFLEKLTVTQLVMKFLAFYGTRKFITVFTRPRM
jgi:hypothetical protein